MADAKRIGSELVALCKEGKNLEAIEKFYADDIVSVESVGGAGFPREMAGKEAVIGKGKWWAENHEIHGAEVKGPFPHGEDKFAVVFNYDVTFKPESRRMQMEEVGIYQVDGGKVRREEFFYNMG